MKTPALADLERLIAIHSALLDDRVRNRAFEAALAARVTPDSVVLDAGAGSGIWAIAAARLGARRVVAVEQDPSLPPLIEALAHENRVADRVEVVCGDLRTLRLPRVFDLVVSETVGNAGFDEGIVELLAVARRFLRPGGSVIPESLALKAAPVREARPPAGRTPSRRVFDALAVQFPRDPRGPLRPLAPAAELASVDLGAARRRPALSGLEAGWTLARGRAASGVAVWVELRLAPGVRLETFAGTHWRPLVFPLERLPDGPGRLEFHLELTPEPPRWQVGFEGAAGRWGRAYSPLFAYGWLKPRLDDAASPTRPSRSSRRR